MELTDDQHKVLNKMSERCRLFRGMIIQDMIDLERSVDMAISGYITDKPDMFFELMGIIEINDAIMMRTKV